MDERTKAKLREVFQEIPIPERPEALAYLWELTASGQGAEKPDISGKPKYQGYKEDGDAVDFLEQHYGTREQLIMLTWKEPS